ncbi:latent-transforming growth factor beta-binding protein 1 [Elysia marginata]|uniref:Latent-transforming growth factor beta-binding protein 1 n=1 Tax=Elysia marginata TaxID=1093978 RepID=A0AAV4GZ50_9GAST|nr:latent-transforming growth factor beta-binding protein 1 [Elysia marginata]
MSLVTTIFGLICLSHLAQCTVTKPNLFCAHSDTSDPIVLNETTKLCAERNVYTPPELTCTLHTASVKTFYTGKTDATVTDAKITIKKGGDLSGLATATFYKKLYNTKNIRDVYSCSLFAYQPAKKLNFLEMLSRQSATKSKIKHLKFDYPTDCYLWSKNPLSAGCVTINRIRRKLNRDGGNYARPVNCRLMPQGNDKSTTFYGNNLGSNHRLKYIHAKISIYTRASLIQTEDGNNVKLQSNKGQKTLSITNKKDLMNGYVTYPTKVYAFKRILSPEFCTHVQDRKLPLTITPFVKSGVPTYSLTSRRPDFYRYYPYSDYNITVADYNKLKENANRCFGSKGNLIIRREQGDMIVSLDITRPPQSDKERKVRCEVHNENYAHADFIANSITPQTTKVIGLPNALKQDYNSHETWTFLSDSVYCFAYKNAVTIWMGRDVILTKVKYETSAGVAFSNTYTPGELRSKAQNLEQCVLSGPADRCTWLNKCGTNKYCTLVDEDQLECKCKKTFDALGDQCVLNKVCMNGFEYSEQIDGCEDINECIDNPCINDKYGRIACVNTFGSHYCVQPKQCPRGSVLNIINKTDTCVDINECEKPDLNNCDPELTTCHNRMNGYDCMCKDQYNNFLSDNGKNCEDYAFEIRLVNPEQIRCCTHFHPMSAMLVRCRVDPKNATSYLDCKPFACAEFALLKNKQTTTSVLSSPYVESNEVLEVESLLQLTKMIEANINKQQNEVRVTLDTHLGKRIYHGSTGEGPSMKRSVTYKMKPVGKQFMKGHDKKQKQCLDLSTMNDLKSFVTQPRPTPVFSHHQDKSNNKEKKKTKSNSASSSSFNGFGMLIVTATVAAAAPHQNV